MRHTTSEQQELKPLMVTVYNNNLDRALKQFKQKVKDSGVLRDYVNSTFCVRKGQKRRMKHHASVNRRNIRLEVN